ncbi:hypothetical protein CW304_11990 [Bacillus sp. UFRGS-B20]|nr:hypothetical protein CW304_11990 [Bacillus sp. UFRGS-B20]
MINELFFDFEQDRSVNQFLICMGFYYLQNACSCTKNLSLTLSAIPFLSSSILFHKIIKCASHHSKVGISTMQSL